MLTRVLLVIALFLVLGSGTARAAASNTMCYNAPTNQWLPCTDTAPLYGRNQGAGSAAVTPSDTVALPGGATRALYNGNATACDIAMKLANDSTQVTFANVQSGAILPFSAKQIMSTGTTCSGIVAIY